MNLGFNEFLNKYLQVYNLEKNIYIFVDGEYFYFLADLKYIYEFNYFVDLFCYEDGKKLMTCLIVRNFDKGIELKILYHAKNDFPDISKIWKAADWPLSEAYDLYGLQVEGRAYRLLNGADFKGHSALNSFTPTESYQGQDNLSIEKVRSKTVVDTDKPFENWIEIPPYDLFVDSKFKLLLNISEGNVLESHIELGYEHKGIEKALESKSLLSSVSILDDLNLNFLGTYSACSASTIENAFNIEIPEKAVVLRMLQLEMGRVCEHLKSIRGLLKYFNLGSYVTMVTELKEIIHILSERISGSRYLYGQNKIGGVKNSLPIGWGSEFIQFIKISQKKLNQLLKSFTKNSFFYDAMKGKEFNVKDSLKWSLTGPNLRASGVNYDLRKNRPYYFYSEVDFDVPVGVKGSLYDLFILKIEEIFQSLKIISQLLDNIPFGENSLSSEEVEAKLNASNLNNEICCYSLESPNGEIKQTNIFTNNKFVRFRLRTPSYINTQPIQDILQGRSYEKFLTVFPLMSLYSKECDR